MKHFSKLITVCFIILLVSLCAVPAFAADGDAEYDEDELKATLREAFDLYDCFEGARTESDFVGEPEFLFPNLPKIDPYLYTRRTGKYALWKDVLAYLDASYTKEAKEIFLRKMDGGEKDGYTYTDWTNAQVQGYFLIETDRISLDQTFKITDVSEEKITASFQIEHAIMEAEFLDYTVEFTKENGKWLVSGGTFFEECIASRKDSLFVTEQTAPKTAPPTGDAAPMLIVLAAASAFAVVVIRRRIRAR